jgi:ADP-ribosyl-[dinitrogen reductase] hydrolase
MIDQYKREKLKSAVYGFAVGDAMGVPYEFISREQMDVSPAIDMIGNGTHNQPPGIWSDDTSMMLCVLENLSEQGDFRTLSGKFLNWYENAAYTATNAVFDVGITVASALDSIRDGQAPEHAGATDDWSAGNGSLMRSLPYAFLTDINEVVDRVYAENTITHALDICSEASLYYILALRCLIEGGNKISIPGYVTEQLAAIEESHSLQFVQLKTRTRLFQPDFIALDRKEIRSTGYVVHTIEACMWCFLRTDNYKDAVLAAVNLGEDTDTVAALTGGLAGIYYDLKDIPEDWLQGLKGKELIDQILSY